jgi:hypothetical protein
VTAAAASSPMGSCVCPGARPAVGSGPDTTS